MKTGLVWDERYMWYDFGSYAQLFGGARYIQPGTVGVSRKQAPHHEPAGSQWHAG